MTAAHTRSGRWRIGAIALALGMSFTILVSMAGAARAGELAYEGCISGSEQMGPQGSELCSLIPGASFKGWNSGLGSLTSIAASPDGRTLYSGAGIDCLGLDNPRCNIDAAVGRFHLDSTSGALRYRGCVTGATGNGPRSRAHCSEIPNATFEANGAGLGAVTSETLSPDGRFLYAGSDNLVCTTNDAGTTCYGSNVITTFSVDADGGALTYVGCITGDRRSGPSGSGACAQIPHATADGSHSGLSGPLRLVVSTDGRSLYAASEDDSAIARFNRNPTTGAVTYRGCITADQDNGPSGSRACAAIPSASKFAVNSGMENPTALALTRDGHSLYVGSNHALATFARDTGTGALTYMGCLTGSKREGPSGSGACDEIPSATKTGGSSGLQDVQSLAPTADGESVYAAGYITLVTFDRRANGSLAYDGCLTGYDGPRSSIQACRLVRGAHNDAALSGLGDPVAVHGGKTVYAGVDGGVAHLKRDPKTGKLSFRDCVATYEKHDRSVCNRIPLRVSLRKSPAFGSILSLAPTGDSVYAGVFRATIAHLAIAPQTKIANGPKGTTRKRGAVLRFRASKPSTFECKLTGKHVKSKLRHWRPCGSHSVKRGGKERYQNLGPGRKVFKVKATNGANTTDPTSASRRWRIR